MQIMFNPNTHAKEYHDKGKEYSFPDLTSTLCPHCRKKYLRKHGFYKRYFISKEFTGHILIRRHICPHCGRTVSSIPFFCHPRRAYCTDFITLSLHRYYNKTSTLSPCINNFSLDYGIECSRQLLYHYRKRFSDNLNFLSMSLLEIFKKDGFVFESEQKKRARQVLSMIHHTDATPLDVSFQLFNNNGHSYLTQLHFRV